MSPPGRQEDNPKGAGVEGFFQSYRMAHRGSCELQETGTGDLPKPAKWADKAS